MTLASSKLPARAAAAAAVVALFAASAASARPAPDGFADLVEALSPSVVAVTVGRAHDDSRKRPFATPRGFSFEKFFERRFGRPEGRGAPPRAAAASGFIVDPSGYIATNHHVIAGAGEIAVTLASGERLEAALVGADPKTDLALLKVDAEAPLPALRWGDSDAVRVGDWSLAIGNPFGLGGTVTAGIVSGRARDLDAGPFDDFPPDRRAHQSGQFGRPAVRPRRRGDRHQYGHRFAVGRQCRDRLRHPFGARRTRHRPAPRARTRGSRLARRQRATADRGPRRRPRPRRRRGGSGRRGDAGKPGPPPRGFPPATRSSPMTAGRSTIRAASPAWSRRPAPGKR